MNRKIQNILNPAKRMGATHYIEVWVSKSGETGTADNEISRLYNSLKMSLESKLLRTSHVFLIKEKPNLQK